MKNNQKTSKNHIHIHIDQTSLPNKMHLRAQQTVKAHIFKPKKGKGSWRRNKKVDDIE